MSPACRGLRTRMRLLLALLAPALLAACTTSAAFRAGERAERSRDWDRAVLEYSRALQERPSDVRARERLTAARVRASEEHARAARALAARGRTREALEEFRLAVDLNPDAPGLADEARALERRGQGQPRPAAWAEAREAARERTLPGLAVPADVGPLGLDFRNASLREAYLALGRAAGINVVFDPGFQDQVVSLDLRDVPFEQALQALARVGRTFHRVVDAKVVLVLPDTPAKQREHEQQFVRTFFLSNAELKEAVDLLRIVLGARRVAPLPGQNALTMNDTPDKIAAAERILAAIDKPRSEVVIEVEILEVNRTRLRDYGIELTSIDGEGNPIGVAGAIFPDPTNTSAERNPYRRDNLVVTALPGVIYRLLKTDADTRVLANPQLRASEGQTAQARFGEQVPIPVTTFAPFAQGGVSQQAITSFEYKNVGVNIDITPRVHHEGDVSLGLKLDISSVGPTGYQGLPTFNSRTVNSTLRLKEGETNVLAGLISETERASIRGVPGLSDLPLIGRLFGRNLEEASQTDIVMTLTPHVVSRPELTADDLKSFEVGGEPSPTLFEVPTLPSTAPAPRTPEPLKIEPIRPPQAQPSPTPQP